MRTILILTIITLAMFIGCMCNDENKKKNIDCSCRCVERA